MITTSWRNGERNIVERASERKATTVSSKWSVEPEIPLPAPFSAAQASAALPAPIQGLMGTWDIGALLSAEAVHAPTPPLVTVESALDFLACLPQSLSEPERCLQVQEFLRERGAEGTLVAAELVGEAAQKIVEIHQSLKGQEEHFQQAQAKDEDYVLALEERLDRIRRQIKERQEAHDQNRQEQRTRLDELMGTIVFFDNYQSFVLQQKREQEDPLRSQLKHHGRLAFV